MALTLLPAAALAETPTPDTGDTPTGETGTPETDAHVDGLDEETLAYLKSVGVTAEEYLWAASAEQSELSLAKQAEYIAIWQKLNAGLVRSFATGDSATPFLISNAS